MIGKTLTDKSDPLKGNIKTQTGGTCSEVVEIYVPLFRNGSSEDLLKPVTILNKITKRQDLSTGHQKYGMAWNMFIG